MYAGRFAKRHLGIHGCSCMMYPKINGIPAILGVVGAFSTRVNIYLSKFDVRWVLRFEPAQSVFVLVRALGRWNVLSVGDSVSWWQVQWRIVSRFKLASERGQPEKRTYRDLLKTF